MLKIRARLKTLIPQYRNHRAFYLEVASQAGETLTDLVAADAEIKFAPSLPGPISSDSPSIPTKYRYNSS